MTPLVSITCITYNHEQFISETIEGFLRQKTTFPIEILIHDDASTDRTADVIRKYEKDHPDLIFPIYQKENQYSKGNLPGKINLERAKGKYLAFCEGDDYWTDPFKLQKQVDFLELNPDFGLVHTDNNNFFENNRKSIKSHKAVYYPNPPSGSVFNELLMKNFISTLTVMVRTDIIKDSIINLVDKMDSNLIIDYSMWLEVSIRTKIKYLSDITAAYRYKSGSASHPVSAKKNIDWLNKIIAIQDHFLKEYKVSKDVRSDIILDRFYNRLKKQYKRYYFQKKLNDTEDIYKIISIKDSFLILLYKLNAPRFFYIILEIPRFLKSKLNFLSST